MTASAARIAAPAPELPPSFSWVAPRPAISVHDFACEVAPRLGAGTMTGRVGASVLELALVLEPEEALQEARRAFLTCMAALADAVAACAPPELPVVIRYPDCLEFNAARLGGGRLAWPEGCAEDEVPDWLVFSAMLIVSKRDAGDPGLTPESTGLEEEGFGPEAPDAIMQAFPRYLLLAFDAMREGGSAAAAEPYGRWLAEPPGSQLDADGALRGADGSRIELASALAEVTWLDPATGAPRL